MESGRRSRAVFMAFGTKGDVFPVAAVAAGFAKARHDYSITFITHSAHESLTLPFSTLHVKLIPISSPPVISADSLKESVPAIGMPPGGASFMSSDWKLKLEEQHREGCLKAVDQIFGSDLSRSGDFIVINFFALEGWHLAELYQIPCVVAAPYVVPYSIPASFERRFQTIQPLLHGCLKEAIPGKVGWKDVVHWMWPLFTDRWIDWRSKKLHLSPFPLTDPVTELPVVQSWPCEPLLLYGFSKDIVECPSYWPKNVRVCGFWFLPETWDPCIIHSQVCGKDSIHSLPLELVDFLKGSTVGPIFIGLSSIGSMGLLTNSEGMLCVLKAVLEAADRTAILFTAAHPPLDAAVLAAASHYGTSLSIPLENLLENPRELCKSYGVENDELCQGQSMNLNRLKKGIHLFNKRLFCFSGSVPYLHLFPKCSLIIHHGGSGTTAAALRSGVPQVICPFVLDQFYWAERMSWIGVAPEPLKKQHLIPLANYATEEAVSNLLRAIEDASRPEMRACAAALGERIRNEDGVSMAVETLCNELCS